MRFTQVWSSQLPTDGWPTSFKLGAFYNPNPNNYPQHHQHHHNLLHHEGHLQDWSLTIGLMVDQLFWNILMHSKISINLTIISMRFCCCCCCCCCCCAIGRNCELPQPLPLAVKHSMCPYYSSIWICISSFVVFIVNVFGVFVFVVVIGRNFPNPWLFL